MRELIPATVPGIVKAAVIVTFFNTWVFFEETVVHRYGLWEVTPYTGSRSYARGTSARWRSSSG